MSRNQKVLNYLIENGSITSMEAYSRLSVTTLTEAVRDLRGEGHVIDTQMNYPAGKSRFGRYTLISLAKKAA